MEDESTITCSGKSTSSGRVLVASGVKIKQEEEEDTSLQYQRNLEKVFDESAERYKKLPKGRQKYMDALFDEHLEDLVRFHNEYGHWRVRYHDKRRLYYWLQSINRSYEKAYNEGQCFMNYTFPRHRYEKLVAIGYPFEEIPRDMTPPDISTTTSRDPIPSLVSPSSISSTISSDMKIQEDENETWSFTQSIPSLSMSQEESTLDSNIRRSKRNIENKQKMTASIRRFTKHGSIDYKRNLDNAINSYTEKLSEKRRKNMDETFDIILQSIVEFYNEFGHFKVPKGKKEYTKVYNWVKKIIWSHKRASLCGEQISSGFRLTRARYERLVAIGFPFEEVECEGKDSANSTIQLLNHSSSTSEGNATKVSSTKVRKKVMTTPTIPKDATATVNLGREYKKTNISREENNLLKAKILQLEKENETHYETIYRLKDEKESSVKQAEELSKQLEVYKKREKSLEHDDVESTSSNSCKRRRTYFESSDTEIERLQQERQLLIDQLTASTDNYRKLLRLVPQYIHPDKE